MRQNKKKIIIKIIDIKYTGLQSRYKTIRTRETYSIIKRITAKQRKFPLASSHTRGRNQISLVSPRSQTAHRSRWI